MKKRKLDFDDKQERKLMKAFLNEDDEPSLGDRVWTKTKQAAKDTGKVLGEATLVVTEEAAEWVDAGFDLLLTISSPEPKRKRNPYL